MRPTAGLTIWWARPYTLYRSSYLIVFLVVLLCPVVVSGDFNIDTQDLGDPGTCRLAELPTLFDMNLITVFVHQLLINLIVGTLSPKYLT